MGASPPSGVEPHNCGADLCPRPKSSPRTTTAKMYPAELLDLYQGRDASWWVVVRYSTEPGSTYIRAEPADRCRPVSGYGRSGG
jgi:hypothetical protein